MKRNLYLLAIIAAGVLALPSEVSASSHRIGGIVDANSTNPLLWVIAILYDNVMHFAEHVLLTTSVFLNDPASALMVLDGIGEACFTALPPASHALFANGVTALATSALAWILTAWASLALLARLRDNEKPATTALARA